MNVTGRVLVDISDADDDRVHELLGPIFAAPPTVHVVLVVGKRWPDWLAVSQLRDFAKGISVDVQGAPTAVAMWVSALRGSEDE